MYVAKRGGRPNSHSSHMVFEAGTARSRVAGPACRVEFDQLSAFPDHRERRPDGANVLGETPFGHSNPAHMQNNIVDFSRIA